MALRDKPITVCSPEKNTYIKYKGDEKKVSDSYADVTKNTREVCCRTKLWERIITQRILIMQGQMQKRAAEVTD